MKRRQVLALLGSAAVGGCVGREVGNPPTRRTTAETTTGATYRIERERKETTG